MMDLLIRIAAALATFLMDMLIKITVPLATLYLVMKYESMPLVAWWLRLGGGYPPKTILDWVNAGLFYLLIILYALLVGEVLADTVVEIVHRSREERIPEGAINK